MAAPAGPTISEEQLTPLWWGRSRKRLSLPAGVEASHAACRVWFLKSVVADWRRASVEMGQQEVSGGLLARM